MNPRGNHKHGGHGTLTYTRWKSMIQRCTDPSADNFKHYGGKGVMVCDRWRESFAAFRDDMGECPSVAMTLDRRDNSRGYEPGNCRWATKAEQNQHRSSVLQLTHAGRTMNATQWAAELGMSANTLRSRLRIGWSVERALTTPLGDQGGARGIKANRPSRNEQAAVARAMLRRWHVVDGNMTRAFRKRT